MSTRAHARRGAAGAALAVALLGLLALAPDAERRAAAARTPVRNPELGPAMTDAAEPAPSTRGRERGRPRPSRAATVAAALARAHAAGRLAARAHRRHRRTYRRAQAAVARLAGARRVEMAAAVAVVDDLAARRLLTVERMPAAFLSLRRNLEVWTRHPLPRPGQRFRFGRDPAIFQFFPGRGVALHPLASFGRVNGLARECLERRRKRDARRRTWGRNVGAARRLGVHPGSAPPAAPRCRSLRRALTRLIGLGGRRAGFVAWEYLVAYGGGTPPWISGMAQATAVQALARAGTALDEPRFLATADRALGAFEQAPPVGVRVRAGGGSHYLLYSFNPRLRVLNGFLQSVLALHETAELSGSRRARRLFLAADRVARRAVKAYDTGAWSLYARGGLEAPLGYHSLMRDQLRLLCRGVGARSYCGGERRLSRYLREPPRVTLAPPRLPVARRSAAIVFSLSKISSVRVRIRAPRGAVLRRSITVPRGRHTVRWTPTRRGRHRLRLEAVDLAGNRTLQRTVVAVKPFPRPSRERRETRHARKRERQSRGRSQDRRRPPDRRQRAEPRRNATRGTASERAERPARDATPDPTRAHPTGAADRGGARRVR